MLRAPLFILTLLFFGCRTAAPAEPSADRQCLYPDEVEVPYLDDLEDLDLLALEAEAAELLPVCVSSTVSNSL